MTVFSVPAHPGASSASVSSRMGRLRRRDTAPEMLLRRELHRRGRRFRVAMRVPGNNRRTIDIAFTRQRVAVMVDGCFWHGCPAHGSAPSSNAAWWRTKLAANAARDADTDALLRAAGWRVIRVWEHVSASAAADLVETALEDTGRAGHRRAERGAGPPR